MLILVVNNKNYDTINVDNYHILTRQRNNWHQPQANLAIFQKGGIKIFSSLPTEIKNLPDNPMKFKIALNCILFTLILFSG